MKPLDALTEKHPLASGAIAAASGFFGWFLENIEPLTQVATFLGSVAGTVVSCLAIASYIRNWNKPKSEGH